MSRLMLSPLEALASEISTILPGEVLFPTAGPGGVSREGGGYRVAAGKEKASWFATAREAAGWLLSLAEFPKVRGA